MNAAAGSPRAAGLAMSDAELDQFLASQRGCRVATISTLGPHITGMSFVWLDRSVWLNSNVRTQRFVDIARDPRVCVHFEELGDPIWLSRFVEVQGQAVVVGEVPRMGRSHRELDQVERAYAAKYGDGVLGLIHDGPAGRLGGHAWIKVVPRKFLTKSGTTITAGSTPESSWRD